MVCKNKIITTKTILIERNVLLDMLEEHFDLNLPPKVTVQGSFGPILEHHPIRVTWEEPE